MAEWRRPRSATRFVGALIDGGARLVRRKPEDLPTFLAALDSAEPHRLLGTSEGRRDAHAHLGLGWDQTVLALARPESLPSVVERRSRTRVNPVAPWLTAGTAAAGSGIVVAGSAGAMVEVAAVVAVAGACAIGSGWLWRPRASRRDRRFTISGTPAIAGRAEALVAQQPLGDPEAVRAADRLLAQVHGATRDVEEAEGAAGRTGLIDEQGQLLLVDQLSPAHRSLVEDVIAQRARLVQCLLHLQHAVLRVDEEARGARRAAYRRIIDDLDA